MPKIVSHPWRMAHVLAVMACLLPPAALVYCVLLCIRNGTGIATHCTDANFLPSLSAAVSDEDPQRSIWSISLFLSSAYRLYILPFVAVSYIQTFGKFFNDDYSCMLRLQFGFGFAEIVFLNAMSLFPSTYRYEAHRDCLTVFVFSSIIYMIFDISLLSILKTQSLDEHLESNVRVKKRILAAYVLLMTIVGLCYYVHVTYCPSYVYTLFSFFEYLTIFVNVSYHYMAFRPFRYIPVGAFAKCPVRGHSLVSDKLPI
ncbi:unnamed protein product [Calicophoron daubneyi]|uniref:CWH43-like N-terminal domain-containing protein n=1 Tax=Calicophoron daubneyi TaxID=300641 RepID=A0AAV2T591_CALDB